MQPTEPVSRPESNGVSPSVDTGGSLNSQSIRNRDADVIGATDMRQPRRGRWRVWLLTIVLPVFLVGGSLLYIIFRPKPLTGDNIKTTSVALEGVLSGRTASTGTQKTSELAINGDLRVGGKLTLSEQAVNNLLSVLGSKVELQASFPGTLQAGNINVDGTVGAGNFVGSGAGITNLNATNISSGTLSNARLSGQVTLLGQSIPLSALQANVISSINSLTNNGGNIDIVAGSNISLSASGSSVTISTTGGSVLAPGGTTNRLAKFSAPQTLVDTNISDNGSLVTVSSLTLVQPTVDSTTAFRVQNSTGLTNVLVADTSNARVAINQASASYTLDVNGDINSTTNVRVGGVAVCSVSGCVAASGNGNYIQNSTSEQASANLNIKSAAAGAIGAVIKGTAAQTADILQLRDNSNNQMVRFGATGAVTLQNSTNSSQALTVKNQVGTELIVADTTNMQVGLGTDGACNSGWGQGVCVNGDSVKIGTGGGNISMLFKQSSNDVFSIGAAPGTNSAGIKLNANNQMTGSTTLTVDGSSLYDNKILKLKSGLRDGDVVSVGQTDLNRILNPSFEADTSGWSVLGNALLSRNTTTQYSGDASMQIGTSGLAGDGAKYPTNLRANAQYILSMYIWNSGQISDIDIGYYENGTETNCLTNEQTRNYWQKKTCTFTTSATPGANTYIYIRYTGASALYFYLDAVTLSDEGVTPTIASSFSLGDISLNGNIVSPVVFKNQENSDTAFQVQTAAGANVLKVDTGGTSAVPSVDVNGQIIVNNTFNQQTVVVGYANGPRIRVGNSYYDPNGYLGTKEGYKYTIDDNAETNGTQKSLEVQQTFNPTSGNADYIGLLVNSTINQTGSASGNYTGLKVEVTETAALGSSRNLLDLSLNGNSQLLVTNNGEINRRTDGDLNIGTTNNADNILLSTADAKTITLKGSSSSAASNIAQITSYAITHMASTSGTSRGLIIDPQFVPTSGNAKFIGLDVSPIINQTGSASGDYTALQIRPTITAATGTNKLLLDIGTAANTGQLLMTETGKITIKNSTNSTTAFVVQNSASSPALTVDTTNLKVTVNDLAVNGHIISGGSAPTYTAGASAGTGPTISLTGTDTAGKISVTVGTAPSAGTTLVTVNFANSFSANPSVTLTPTNSNTASLSGGSQVYVTAGTSSFSLVVSSGSLGVGSAYTWDYHVIQ